MSYSAQQSKGPVLHNYLIHIKCLYCFLFEIGLIQLTLSRYSGHIAHVLPLC